MVAACKFLLLLLITTAVYAQNCKLKVSNHDETILFSKADIERLTDGNIIDAPISTFLWNGKNVWLLPTARQYNDIPVEHLVLSHHLTIGSVKDPAQADIGEFSQRDFIVDSDNAISGTKGYKWITNTYQTPEGVLGFVHSEYTDVDDHWHMACDPWVKKKQCAPGNSKVGLAWMKTPAGIDEKPQFKYLGHIAGYSGDRRHFNVHGVPWFINIENGKEYLNIVYHDTNGIRDWGQITRARSPLRDVLAAAKEGSTTKWEKYNRGSWEDALNGQSSSILPLVPILNDIDPEIAKGHVIVHGDVVKHRESGRYFLAAYTLKRVGLAQRPSRLVFYDSCDGTNWQFNSFSNERADGEWGWSYLTFVDDDGSDNGMASGLFNLIAGFDYGRPLKRVELLDVTVPESCRCTDMKTTEVGK